MNYWNKTCSLSEVCVLHWGRMWCVLTEHARRVDYFNVLHTQIFSYLFFSPILSYFLCPGTAVSFFLTAVYFFLSTLTPWMLVTAVRLLFFQSYWQLSQSFCPVDICQFLLVPLTAVSFFLFHWFFSVLLTSLSFSLCHWQLSASPYPVHSCQILLVPLLSLCPVYSCHFSLSCWYLSVSLSHWQTSTSPCPVHSCKFLPVLASCWFLPLLLTSCRFSLVLLTAVSDCDTSGRFTWHGHEWHLRPLRQGLPGARQEEEVWDQGAPQDAQPCLQWDLHLQGWYRPTCFSLVQTHLLQHHCIISETVSNPVIEQKNKK